MAENASTAIHVGMVNAQTAPQGSVGLALAAAAKAVFSDVNAAGGIHGRPLVLHVEDDGFESVATVERTLALVDRENIVALLGYQGAPNVNAVRPVIEELGVPLVGVFSGARSLRQPASPQLFHLRPSYAEETEALVDHLVRDGTTRIAMLYQNDSLGLDSLRGVKAAVERRGLTLVGKASYQRGTLALRESLATLLAARPDAIVFAAMPDVTAWFMQEARRAGLAARFASISSANGDAAQLESIKASGEWVLLSQIVPMLDEEGSAAAAECQRVLRRWGDVRFSPVTFEGCLNARTLVEAIRAAGPAPTRASIRASLEAMAGLDLGGFVVGFSPENHEARSRVYLSEVKEGRIVSLR